MSGEQKFATPPIANHEHIKERIGPTFALIWLKPEERDQQLEAFATLLLEKGVQYLKATVGTDYEFARNIDVIFTPRLRHGAQGAEMRLSIGHLREAMNGGVDRIALEQSLIIHELVHGLVDEEELPMMIELAYIAEHGYAEQRFQKLAAIDSEGGLGKPYQEALQNIATILGAQTIQDLASLPIDASMAEKLKQTFAQEIQKEFTSKNTAE
jgi:hypothetical protein